MSEWMTWRTILQQMPLLFLGFRIDDINKFIEENWSVNNGRN